MEVDSSGNVYLADLYGNRIIKYDSNTAYQSYFGSYGSNQINGVILMGLIFIMTKFT